MNKKLLLSFAVFATAMSVNAQKRGFKTPSLDGVKSPKHISVVSDLKETNPIEEKNTSVNTNGLVSSKKRATLTIVDTSTYFSSKRSYASPKTSSTILTAYPSAAGDSTELSTAYQIIPNNSQITMKGVRMSMVSLNKGAKKANVDVKVYSLTDGSTLAQSRKEVAYSATAYGVYDFIFDKPVVTNSDILVSIEPATEIDSVQIPNSGGYRNSSITCNITGDQLTIVSPAPSTNLGTSFWVGQGITGTGIAAGTKIIGVTLVTAATQTTPAVYSYKLSSAATAPLTNVVVTGVNLTFDDQKNKAGMYYFKFPTVAGSKTKPDFTKKAKESQDALIWINLGTSTAPNWKPYDANITMFPIVEYVFESTPDIDNKCLGDKNEVNITYKNTNAFNIAKNPLLNKMAFWTKYLGYNKQSGYFFSRVISSGNASFRDSIDLATTPATGTTTFGYKKFTYTATDKNDTLKVYDFILPYGYMVSPGTKGFTSTFLLSSKVTPAASITPVSTGIKCYLYDAKTVLPGIGGFAPYTGLPKIGDAAGKFSVVDVNGCKGDITTTAMITSDIKEIVAKATVTDAKCFGDKTATVEITATGGTGTLVIPAKETLTTLGTTKSYVVKDANNCEVKVDAVIKNAPAAIVPVATVTDAKCFGVKASVEVKATGGTGTLTGTGKFDADAVAGDKSFEVKDANGCTAKVNATIKAAPAAIVLDTVAVSAENKTKNNGLAVVKVTGGVAPYTYLWNDAAATKNDTLSKVIGAFKVTVTDANGCTKVASATIADKKVSVTELGLTNIAVYPNPVKETLNVRFDATSIATVELVNVAGQVLDSKTNSDVTFNTAGLVAGMYFVNIKVAEGVYTHKIIKE